MRHVISIMVGKASMQLVRDSVLCSASELIVSDYEYQHDNDVRPTTMQ